MSATPICFRCVHFRQYQPLHFRTPGECGWQPKEAVPVWLQFYLDSTDRYYGPKREVTTDFHFGINECEAFKEKTNDTD